MRRALLAGLVALSACGGAPAPNTIVVADSCDAGDLRVELEAGAETVPCAFVATVLDGYRATYEGAWGRVDVAGWTVRVRSSGLVNPDGELVAGQTYPAERVIDLRAANLSTLPHELHHVATGPTHDGWCPYFAWEATQGFANDGAHYGCRF